MKLNKNHPSILAVIIPVVAVVVALVVLTRAVNPAGDELYSGKWYSDGWSRMWDVATKRHYLQGTPEKMNSLHDLLENVDSRIDDWYAVEQWEIDVCSQWGGPKKAQQGEISSLPNSLSQFTVSLQGRKETMPDGSILYEASWYIQPVSGEVEYSITLIGTGIQKKIENKKKASYEEPAVEFYSEYNKGNYDSIKLESSMGDWTVPLVTVSSE